ncbi:CAAX amino terminal protease family protein [Candidatus Protochlamydia naegleriophila]|uniref:CAAX amino terminal protease family protein n=1 Tax=Candidatus Protochlamydia naegleriophila TaxID=389348 RepID=A0A0U5CN97_9BACT|nr:type II CAAX endopeptidase family protein [Candidatus Protochlamydia naegleriophila]CUI16108.1 CAAX amino terminal protease family protein [Candidatus Protochlamydia naegleriophila]
MTLDGEKSSGESSLRFPLTSYFILAYLLSWLVWGSFVLSRNGAGLLPFNSPMPFLPTVALGAFGPSLAALIVIGMSEGWIGIRDFLKRIMLWRVRLWWYFFALIGIPLIMTLGSVILPDVWTSFTPIRWDTLFAYALFFIYPALIIGGPLGEEPGWRGFALPRLQKRYGPLMGSIILGLLWSLWHMPIWFSGQWTKPTIPNIALYMTWIVGVSIIMTWIFNHTKGSIFMAIVVHASVDAFPNAILWPLFPELTQLTDYNFLYGYLGLAIGFEAVALVLIALTRGRLGYRFSSNSLQ